ncbi:MAG: asparagine--tRNA ligase [Eubacteriales bacterium]|nr:asparagine--tRNA ligase [Eubacteriales bacterium]
MKMDLVKDIFLEPEKYYDKEVTVGGWVRSIRSNNNFGFVVLNDGTTFQTIQIVIDAEKLENYTELTKQNVGAALIVTGNLVATPQAKQPFEVQAGHVFVEGESTPDYPLQKKKHGFEFLRTLEHLRARTNTFMAVYRVRSIMAFAIHKFFMEKGFVYVHTPIITGSDAEGAGDMFRVTTLPIDNPPMENGKVNTKEDFFGKPVNLTVSGQIDVEPFAMAFRNVYTFGPTFRAEKSNTTRHAAEFWMIEPEMAFADLEDDMNVAEEMVKYIINYVLEHAPEEMKFFNDFIDKGLLERLDVIVKNDFARITYTEAIEILEKVKDRFEYPVYWGADLQTEHERYITEEVYKKPVFVTNYPKDIKAFYMKLNEDGKTVAATDLLVPGVGEIIGGSQREDNYEELLRRIKEKGLVEEEYKNYLELRKYGSNRHAGFGLGFERMLMYVTGMSNIRDVIPYPRTTGYCL